MQRYALACLFAVTGAALLTINALGISSPVAPFGRVPGESDEAFVRRATQYVHTRIVHDSTDGARELVPLTENYLLYSLTKLSPATFGKYEYVDATRAVRRGIGLCSQQSLALADILRRGGISARIVSLGGHVVVESANGLVADPDYGVTMPGDVKSVANSPTLIARTYERSDRITSDVQHGAKRVRVIIGLYQTTGDNVVFPNAASYAGKKAMLEQVSYVAKWLIPPFLLICAWAVVARGRRGRLAAA